MAKNFLKEMFIDEAKPALERHSSVSADGGNTLKTFFDKTKRTRYLFFGYNGEIPNDIIKYSDTENVEDFGGMFYSCSNLTTIPQLDTSSGTIFSQMFSTCPKLPTIPQLDTSNGTVFDSMFYNCSNLVTIPQLDTSSGTNFTQMFYNCSNLTTIPQLDTSSGTSFNQMFYNCSNLTTIPQLDTSSGTTFEEMFYRCSNLVSVPPLNLSSSTYTSSSIFDSTFYYCEKIQKIDISYFDKYSTSSTDRMCYSCFSLKAVIIRSFGTRYVLNSSAFTQAYRMLGKTQSTYNPNGEQGYVYVPRDMMETLQSATNWSALQYRALEDYTKDGTCEGEFDDEKAGLTIYGNS